MNIKLKVAGLMICSALAFASCSDDPALKSDVTTAVNNDDVHVTTDDGVVTLSGEVNDPAEKVRAEADAKKVEGVTSVNNEITVTVPAGADASVTVDGPSGDVTVEGDNKLNNEVQAVIAPFPDVKASVNNGVVTLSGEITRAGNVLLMPKIAGLFPKRIENNLTIK